jgi:hypothetical protein
LAAREQFRLLATKLIGESIQEAFPNLPNGEQVSVVVHLLAMEDGVPPGPKEKAKTQMIVFVLFGITLHPPPQQTASAHQMDVP